MLFVQSIMDVQQHGVKTLVGLRDGIEFSGIADRAIRAFRNAPISLVIITPPAFTLVIITASSPETVGALIIFVKARLSYFLPTFWVFLWSEGGCGGLDYFVLFFYVICLTHFLPSAYL